MVVGHESYLESKKKKFKFVPVTPVTLIHHHPETTNLSEFLFSFFVFIFIINNILIILTYLVVMGLLK